MLSRSGGLNEPIEYVDESSLSLSLSFLIFSPCYADTAKNNGSENVKVYYKAANDSGYILLHSKKDCPFLKNEVVVEVSPLDNDYSSGHQCSTCKNVNIGATGQQSATAGNTKSYNSSSYYKPTNIYTPSANTGVTNGPADGYYPARSSSGNYTTYTGPRGGKYHYSASGKKVYERKRKR
ncbi:MAG: hypothetical protein Q4F00_01090 [bacterium]|nr:hypothetical protein [bacterium]